MAATALVTTDATLDEDENIYCEGCGLALADAEIEESGYQCARCHAASHFKCVDCAETLDNEEASQKSKTRCENCQASKDDAELEQKIDALKDEAGELLEAICNDGDLDQLRRAVAALKRLQPK